MKSKMRKKLIAFMLCMVLVICNSVSILADTPAAETTTAGEQVKETRTAKNENASDDKTGGEDEKNVSKQSEESDKDTPPEVTTTEKKKETTETTTEKKEETTTEASTEKEDPDKADEVTTEAKEESATATTTEKKEETEESSETSEKKETEEAGETTTTGKKEETSEASEAKTETTEEASTEEAEETSLNSETQTETVKLTYEAEDAVIDVTVAEGVFPEGTTFTAKKVEVNTDKYNSVEKSLEKEAAKADKDVLDFIAYDLTFFNAEGNEIEPNGEVQVSFTFKKDVTLGGASNEKSSTDVVHIKDDNKTETIKSEINIKNEQLKKVEFITDEFSIYAVTVEGSIEEYTSAIEVDNYAVIEFWDKNTVEGNQAIEFEEFYRNNYSSDDRYLKIQVYVDEDTITETFRLKTAYSNVNLQTTVKPGDGYYLAKECEWQKAGSDKVDSEFGGSGSTGMNQAGKNPKVNTLTIYLTRTNPNPNCGGKISDSTKPISVDLYNYDTEAYNSAVGLNSGSLLLRSPWGNYKADGYNVVGNNEHNESCGQTGIYYGLVQPKLNNGNIVFKKTAMFFDNQFDSSVGKKYSDVDFEFIYDEDTREYRYNSEENHVHFDESTDTISQYVGAGSGTLSDSSDFTKNGFFPFTNENDNMTDYGFGMRMDVKFQLTENGTIDGSTPMKFSFSGDDDVWVFIDEKLALDLGGLHSRRGGTINFKDKNVTYDQVTYKEGDSSITADATPVDGTAGSKPDTSFLEDLGEGTHTLTMYYLERGGDASNCEIKFNLLVINREGTLEFDKVDSETQTGISGVSFSLYDTDQISDTTEPIATAVSDNTGKVTFDISKLDTSETYYLKEESVPFGYKENNTLYPVTLSEQQEDTTIKVTGVIKDSNEATVTSIENEPKENTGGTTTVTVKKEWQKGIKKVPIEVTLLANGQQVNNPNIVNPVTLQDEPWSHTWNNLPGDTEYTVQETVPEGYTSSTETEYQFDINSPYEVVNPCNQLKRELGSNGVVAIKKGNKYFVWTTVVLSEKEQQQLLEGIRKISKGFGDSNTTFQFGNGTFSELDGEFTFAYEDGKLEMSINLKQAWSWFLLGTYTKTVTTTITNSLDTTKTIDIPVTKSWKGDPEQTDNYDSVTVQLYQNEELYGKPVEILKSKGWEYTFEDLPYYSLNPSDGSVITNQYTVKETKIGTFYVENCSDWLFVDVSGNAEDGFTITNAIPEKLFIQKVSSADSEEFLGGAEFTLTVQGQEEPSYFGKSAERTGLLQWWTTQKDVGNPDKEVAYIEDGIYILEETKAPEEYIKSNIKWTITIEDLQITSITDENGEKIEGITKRALESSTVYQFKNTPYYELPSAGGPGIYWYTFGGTLLMAGAALIVYRQKRKREVLLRK